MIAKSKKAPFSCVFAQVSLGRSTSFLWNQTDWQNYVILMEFIPFWGEIGFHQTLEGRLVSVVAQVGAFWENCVIFLALSSRNQADKIPRCRLRMAVFSWNCLVNSIFFCLKQVSWLSVDFLRIKSYYAKWHFMQENNPQTSPEVQTWSEFCDTSPTNKRQFRLNIECQNSSRHRIG